MHPEEQFPYLEYVEEVWNAHDPGAADRYFAADVRVHSLTPGIGPGNGIDYLKELAQSLFDAFPDVHFVVEDVVQEPGKVAARLVLRGTQSGPFAGIEPAGKRMQIYDFAMYAIAHGKITDVWSLVDMQGLRDQLA